MNVLTTLLIATEQSKDLITVLYGACVGLVGAVVALFYKLDKKSTDYQDKVLQERDRFDIKQEAEKEKYENMLEKVLNAFTTMEKSMLENSIRLPEKLVKAIKEANEPLKEEISKALEEYKKHN